MRFLMDLGKSKILIPDLQCGKKARDNGLRVTNNDFKVGYVYYYNFEEMGYPHPYPVAKGATKFEIW